MPIKTKKAKTDSINQAIYAGQIAHFEHVIMPNVLALDPMCQNCGDNIALPFSVYCPDCLNPKYINSKGK